MQGDKKEIGTEGAYQQMHDQIITTLKQQGVWQEPALPQEYYFYHCNHLRNVSTSSEPVL